MSNDSDLSRIGISLPKNLLDKFDEILDLRGALVWQASFIPRSDGGPGRIVWNGNTAKGDRVVPGFYTIRLRGFDASGRMAASRLTRLIVLPR